MGRGCGGAVGCPKSSSSRPLIDAGGGGGRLALAFSTFTGLTVLSLTLSNGGNVGSNAGETGIGVVVAVVELMVVDFIVVGGGGEIVVVEIIPTGGGGCG